MSIERFFTQTFSVSRIVWANESGASSVVGSFSGHIQQAGAEAAEFLGENWGKTFTIWCAKTTDVMAGDTVIVSSGDYAGSYTVKNSQLNAMGGNPHLALTVVRNLE